MTKKNSWTKSIFLGLWNTLNFGRKLFFNIIFIGIVVLLIVAVSSEDGQVTIPSDSALVLKLNGDLVVQKYSVDPIDEFMREALDQSDDRPEVLLQDVLFAIENAKDDKRIKALVLDVENLGSAGLDKLKQIGAALIDFKLSEKPIYAVGDYFSQNQYYLASHADHLYLNPMGGVILEGYGRYRMYYKSALDKLKAKVHVFKVGKYKSFVEPYLRDDMSEAAREANTLWLNELWDQYKQDVAAERELPLSIFDEKLDTFLEKFERVDGDFGLYALDNGWVDGLKTREEVRQEIRTVVDSDESKRGYAHVMFGDYVDQIKSPFSDVSAKQQIGIVVAKGTILDGEQKAGEIGGDSTARLLRNARENENIKAVVLYVDSPGGSAFASEVIRQEIKQLKMAGKPVVAAMSTYAASGGYWISASADKIVAAPSTITGSIGVFGMFTTFEDSLDYLGLHVDGVGTTEFTGLSTARTLDPKIERIFQRSVERSYDQFISLVAQKRNLTKEAVDEIAQGRVWTGSTAMELGLVDQLGYIDDAIIVAAELANLTEYDTKNIIPPLDPQEQFIQDILGYVGSFVVKNQSTPANNALISIGKQLISEINILNKFNDPRGLYSICLQCEY